MAKNVSKQKPGKSGRAAGKSSNRDSETGIIILDPVVKIPKALRAAIRRGVRLAKEKAQSAK